MYIKLEHYKIFNEAATTLSFSTAARNLFISQSAISQTIQAMEKELKTPLFIRHSKGVSLTKEGELLYKKVNQALLLINEAQNQLTNLHELKEGEIIIGAGDTLAQHVLLPYITQFQSHYPNVHVRIINRTSLEIIELLKNRQIDLGFINLPLSDDALCIHECLDVHDIFVSKHHDTHIYTFEQLALKPLILYEKSSLTRHYLDHLFAKKGILLNPVLELGAHHLLLAFAKEGAGISCVTKEFCQKELNNHELYEIKTAQPLPKRSIGYAYLKGHTLSIATLKFIELLSKMTQ